VAVSILIDPGYDDCKISPQSSQRTPRGHKTIKDNFMGDYRININKSYFSFKNISVISAFSAVRWIVTYDLSIFYHWPTALVVNDCRSMAANFQP
jgi:hypothetical protein